MTATVIDSAVFSNLFSAPAMRAVFCDERRVQYYLDFFMGPARDRFTVWLARLPRYDTLIREALRGA